MNKILPFGFVLAGALFFSACSDSSSSSLGEIPTSSSSVVESSSSVMLTGHAAELVKKMGVGMNMGNIFEAPDEGDWGETFSDEGVKALADSGFGNIRIPVRWETHLTDSSATGCTVDTTWMARITHAVDEVIKNGMIAVVDAHHWASMYTDPEGTKPCFLDVYRQMTTNFKDYSADSLVIELLNEPRTNLAGATWNSLVAETIALIRSISPDRTIMVGGDNWNSYSGLADLSLPDSVSNIIATFHYYEPMTVTHQGTDFDGDGEYDYPLGVAWSATGAEQLAVTKAFKRVKAWSDANLVPVYLGEFGVYTAADTSIRALWTEFVRTTATKLGFACAYWEFSSGFGVYDNDNDIWYEYLMKALLRPSTDFSVYSNYPDLDSTSYVLFDDFDSYSDDYINLNYVSGRLALQEGGLDSGKGYWYIYHDSLSRAFSLLGDTLMSGTLIHYEKLDSIKYKTNYDKMIVENGYTGRGLYVKFNLKGDNYPWVGLGSSINTGNYDFTNLVALSFKAKGKGEFMVSFGMDYADTCCGGSNWGKFQTSIELTENWEEYTLWFDQFVPTPYSDLETEGATWAEHNKAVKNLQFANGQSYGESVDDTLEIYLDDIRFYGMSDSDFGITK
ncbi:MAG: glycoside hydrolase family 5 protein [Fibrobacteraceae bacterium]|nr:glycoside hydrolase family 5 protein [Fibrobacteraceae bacterium]